MKGSIGDRVRESCDPMESPSLHAEDFIDELYDRELAAALPADSASALREIEDALLRLKAGTYGRCERTGRAIPLVQLRALPWRRFAETPKPHHSTPNLSS
jgi:RNA polymerase-binding transcription factor DksA